jgi:hypothetical protein
MKYMIVLPQADRLAMGRAARQKVIKEFDKKMVVNIYLNAIAMYLEK